MNRFAVRGACAAGGLIVFAIYHFANKSSSSQDYRRQAHRIVASLGGYAAKPDYYDWLADEGHDQVFDGAYHTEQRGRYGEKAWVDRDEYLDELFAWMIQQAKTDRADGIVDELTAYRNQHWHPDAK